jgi:predicted nucleotidyltransferase
MAAGEDGVLWAGAGLWGQRRLCIRVGRASERRLRMSREKHLELIQGVINRMAGNSFHLKGWSVVFGSVLREDFGTDSDVDVLVSFQPDSTWDLLDLVDMRDELKALFGRNVDLVEEEGLRNPFRRSSILSTRQVIYAA